jgi:hypothetical protein
MTKVTIAERHKESRDGRRSDDKALYEIHYRVPRELRAPLLATHLTHVRKSAEDRYYEFAERKVLDEFRNELGELALLGDKKQAWEALLRRSHGPHGERPPWMDSATKGALDRTQALGDLAEEICAIVDGFTDQDGTHRPGLDEGYAAVLKHNRALFVFGGLGQIVFLIARQLTNHHGHSTAMTILFARFQVEFREFFNARLKRVHDALDSHDSRETAFRVDEVGGILQQLEDLRKKDDEDKFSTLYDDFRHFQFDLERSTHEHKDRFEYYLRWSRLPQAWNYTFIEVLNERSLVTPAIPTSRPRLNEAYPPLITQMILAAAIDPSVMSSTILPKVDSHHRFPGQYLAGSHYFVLPIAALIAFSVASIESLSIPDGKAIVREVERIRGTRAENPGRAAKVLEAMTRTQHDRKAHAERIVSDCIEIVGLSTVMSLLQSHIVEPSAEKAVRAILEGKEANPGNKTMSERIVDYVASSARNPLGRGIYDFIGTLAGRALQSRDIAHRTRIASLQAEVGRLTEAFWRCTFAVSIEGHLEKVASDFVCSSMVDRRCIYFSNFVPFGDEKFTRTIFVDFGMSDFQRARVLQRLCDILTYRSITTSNLDRVRAAVEALSELNQRLDEVQMRLSSIGDRELREELRKTHEISALAARMNAFLTFGTAGRWFASDSSFKEIIERCEDLREERIPGYAQLTDFVERRLAHVMRIIERMHMHHQTVSQRVTELLDRIRTQFYAWQSDEIARTLAKQDRTAAGLVKAAKSMEVAANDITWSLRQLVDLQKVGEALVLLAGTYYGYKLIHDLLLLEPTAEWFERHAPASEYAVFAAALTIAVTLGFRTEISRACKGAWTLIRARMRRIGSGSPRASKGAPALPPPDEGR